MADEYIETWTAEQIEREIAKFVPGYVPDPEALTDAEKAAKLAADVAARNARANAGNGHQATAQPDMTASERRYLDGLFKDLK